MLGEGLGLQSPALISQDPAQLAQDPAYPSEKSSREAGDELDLSFLPDELSTQEEPSHDVSGMTSADSGRVRPSSQ